MTSGKSRDIILCHSFKKSKNYEIGFQQIIRAAIDKMQLFNSFYG